MLANFRLRNLSSWTMFIFGVLALLLGILGIFKPEFLLSLLGFELVDRLQRSSHDYTLVFLTASSMASLNMGAYYILAALNNMKNFYRWTVPFRCLTFAVFTLTVISGVAPAKFMEVSLWELTGGILTGLALWFEDRQSKKTE